MLSRRQSVGSGLGVVLFALVYVLAARELDIDIRWDEYLTAIPQEETLSIQVKRVIDGDTIELEDGRKVRYIGINTPESVDPRRSAQCFGTEASAFNRELVEGKTVRLEKDVSDTDKYGRLLRFVYLPDGTFVNERLVSEGYAAASPYAPDISKKDFFKAAESRAREEGKGLWSPDTCDGKK